MASETSSTVTGISPTASDVVSGPGCLRFSPRANQHELSAALENIPRYLYRVHAPSTSGQTTANAVVSRASQIGHPGAVTDILALPARDAADMLNCHLRWWPRDYDNLMSWSSSLLFALLYALYRSINEGVGDSLADIRIHVLDTVGLPIGALAPDTALLDACDVDDAWQTHSLSGMRKLRLFTQYYFGEYLSQGVLMIEGRSSSASMQDLVDHGLFRLCPEMREANGPPKLAKRVCEYRADCFAQPSPATQYEIRAALAVAEGCFGGPWTLPMMAALLSLRRRPRNDTVIADAFRANFSEKEIGRQDLGALKTFPHDRLPEVHQFARVIEDIHSDHCARALDSVIATTVKLSLSSPSPRNHVRKVDLAGDDDVGKGCAPVVHFPEA